MSGAPETAPPAVRCRIGGLGLLGPGLSGWAASEPVLAGAAPWQEAAPVVPPPALLAPAERRRASLVVRLALAAAGEAAAASGLAPGMLDTLFASSNGDGAVVGAILDALATPGGDVSPTLFHNSVHNAAAGYWGIGAGSMRPSVSLGCHDDTFPLGLLQAATQVAAWGRPVLFCAYDAPLTPPLEACRPTAVPFAAAMLLLPEAQSGARATLALRHRPAAPATEARPRSALRAALEEANPAARALPLLEALAARQPAHLAWALLDGMGLEAELAPC
ncbi:beta-ketoacyl synthase chain length factor [Roseomonas sp. E05]|uniref:beta-ketoacyl synthase chain length factor n=1 Tax=Roseomonas sp. E05 TaxID=3046310 RepID=UPI0024BB5F92|nr:beta-ketoacyl synthase chain length factor [Roseomonas sp. E05]MDJ0389539.1 beta-ketoacyl synthase chain length factor [Roseomonas sp. E05]